MAATTKPDDSGLQDLGMISSEQNEPQSEALRGAPVVTLDQEGEPPPVLLESDIVDITEVDPIALPLSGNTVRLELPTTQPWDDLGRGHTVRLERPVSPAPFGADPYAPVLDHTAPLPSREAIEELSSPRPAAGAPPGEGNWPVDEATGEVATRAMPVQEMMRRRASADNPASGGAASISAAPAPAPARRFKLWASAALLGTAAVFAALSFWDGAAEERVVEPAPQVAKKPTKAAAAPSGPARGAVTRITPAAASSASVDQSKAIEALVSGDLTKAAALYESLASDHPQVPAYREAARILRDKARPSEHN